MKDCPLCHGKREVRLHLAQSFSISASIYPGKNIPVKAPASKWYPCPECSAGGEVVKYTHSKEVPDYHGVPTDVIHESSLVEIVRKILQEKSFSAVAQKSVNECVTRHTVTLEVALPKHHKCQPNISFNRPDEPKVTRLMAEKIMEKVNAGMEIAHAVDEAEREVSAPAVRPVSYKQFDFAPVSEIVKEYGGVTVGKMVTIHTDGVFLAGGGGATATKPKGEP
jgi:hypothetical protein